MSMSTRTWYQSDTGVALMHPSRAISGSDLQGDERTANLQKRFSMRGGGGDHFPEGNSPSPQT